MTAALRLLAIGDMHLGRRPARLPASGAGEFDPAALGPAAAWARAVEQAVERRVDAVLLAGDVVQSDNQFFEAYGALQRGVRRLVEAGIAVFGVAGNHDTLVLPRLADELAGFHLLGRGGRWERVLLGDGKAELFGWSFPQQHVHTSPLLASDAPRRAGSLPALGLLHGDLFDSASPYAPLKATELAAPGLDLWLLGHIHQPDFALAGGRGAGYLGSLVGLDPSETGLHGPWLLELHAGAWRAEQLACSPLRWETLRLGTADFPSALAAPGRVLQAIEALCQRLGDQLDGLGALGLRLCVEGRHSAARALRAELEGAIKLDLAPVRTSQVRLFVESVDLDELRPALDLAAFARSRTLPGLLAERILELEAPESAAGAQLVQRARARLLERRGAWSWWALHSEPSEHELRALLLRRAYATLESLLAQDAQRAQLGPATGSRA